MIDNSGILDDTIFRMMLINPTSFWLDKHQLKMVYYLSEKDQRCDLRNVPPCLCSIMSLIFGFILMNFHFIRIYKPDESIQG